MIATRARQLTQDRLIRDGYTIAGSSVATSALGMVFWVVAARRSSEAAVGTSASLIAALTVLGHLGQLGLVNGLNRFLPIAGRGAGRLVRRSGLAAATAGGVAGLLFLLGLEAWAPGLVQLAAVPWVTIWFPLVVALWTLFTVQDGALAGLRASGTILSSNLVYALAKIVVLLLLPTAWTLAVFWAWVVPLPFVVAAVWLMVVRRAARLPDRAPAGVEHVPRLSGVVRFAAADHLATTVWTSAQAVLPAIVIGLVGPEPTAHFALTWTGAYVLYLLGRGVTMAQLTESAAQPQRAAAIGRAAVVRALGLVLPAAVVTFVAAPVLLDLFGPGYRAGATGLLRLLVVASLPGVLVTVAVAVLRVTGRYWSLVMWSTAMAAMLLLGLRPATDHFGLVGIGYLWLVLHLGAGTVLGLVVLRPAGLTAASARAMVRSRRPRTGRALRRAASVVAALPPPPAGRWSPFGCSPGQGDVDVVLLGSDADDGTRALLKVSTTARGRQALHAADCGLRAAAAVPVAGLVATPRSLATGEHGGTGWLLESAVDGRSAAALLAAGHDRSMILSIAVRALQHLHAATVAESTAAERSAWVERRAAQIRVVLLERGDAAGVAALDELVATLVTDVSATPMRSGFTHGDAWAGNVLLDPTRLDELGTDRAWWHGFAGDGPPPVGLIDFEAAEEAGPTVVDIVAMVLSGRCRNRRQLGDVVRELRRGAPVEPWEARALAAAGVVVHPGDSDEGLSFSSAVDLGWLHMAAANVVKSDRYHPGTLWFARNAAPLLNP